MSTEGCTCNREVTLASLQHRPAEVTDLPHLSSRELQVLGWTALGKTAAQAGKLMFLSERTVNFHIARLVCKLGAVNKTHAVFIAVRAGLI